jgi:hypothetical protein
METDYSQGRYNVFDANEKLIGRIDEDEFIRHGLQLYNSSIASTALRFTP